MPAPTQPSRCFCCMTNASRPPAQCFLYIDPCPSRVRIVSGPIPAATVPVATVHLPEKGPRNSWLPCRSPYRLLPCPICRVGALSDAAMRRPRCYLQAELPSLECAMAIIELEKGSGGFCRSKTATPVLGNELYCLLLRTVESFGLRAMLTTLFCRLLDFVI